MPPPNTLGARVISIFERARRFVLPPNVPSPPGLVVRDGSIVTERTRVEGGYALFMDTDESLIFYAVPWEYAGVPVCPQTNSSVWLIRKRSFVPSRRDEFGNWIFRCVA